MSAPEGNTINETGDAIIVLQELARALKQSYGYTDENLPAHIALLLMQLALAEVVRAATKEECGGDEQN